VKECVCASGEADFDPPCIKKWESSEFMIQRIHEIINSLAKLFHFIGLVNVLL
jgi:hypothetical protein